MDTLGWAGGSASSKAVVVSHAKRGQLSALSQLGENLLGWRTGGIPITSPRSIARRASNMGGDALRSISGLQVH